MIAHVAIEVRREDVEACLRFWLLLGFERVAAPGALAQRSAWVQAGSTQVHLLFAEEPVAPRKGHVAVVVEDYEGTLARLSGAGFAPDARSEHWGSPRSFVRSPSGHRVELMAFAPR